MLYTYEQYMHEQQPLFTCACHHTLAHKLAYCRCYLDTLCIFFLFAEAVLHVGQVPMLVYYKMEYNFQHPSRSKELQLYKFTTKDSLVIVVSYSDSSQVCVALWICKNIGDLYNGGYHCINDNFLTEFQLLRFLLLILTLNFYNIWKQVG